MSPDNHRYVNLLLGRPVDLEAQEVVKLLPSWPPHAGEHLLVDGVRCRVSRVSVSWNGPRWTIDSLRVKDAR